MQNQCPVSIVATRPADYIRRISHLFVCDGPRVLTPAERAAREHAIEQCADRMARSKTYLDFERTLQEMHKFGTYPLNEDVSLVAKASFMADNPD